ncbi:MAG: hypothetical protein IT516_11395 [Burkholderiales bacterium]|nr:hypothetical protein [Burkholderiales bacterium]
MHCTLVVPGLAATLTRHAQELGALTRLAALGRVQRHAPSLDRILMAAAGLPASSAPAPIAALGAGFDPETQHVLRADPVTLIAGRDDVLVAGRVDDLDHAEAGALCRTLAAHFATDGLSFHTPRPDAWFVTATASVPVETTPLAAIAGPLHPYLPHGGNGNTWRRWLSEMQMLLHEHPVNAAREAAGRQPVTGIWIADGGVLPATADTAAPVLTASLHTTPHAAGDLVRGLARLAHVPVHALPATFVDRRAGDTLVVLDPVASGETLARFVQAWLDPAVAAVERGALDELVVLGDGAGDVQRWSARRPSLATRVRARLRRRTRTP